MTLKKLEEANKIAEQYLLLRSKANSGKKKDVAAYMDYQNYCVTKLSYLVNNKIYKYKKFSNYQDLKQDGLEALIHSFETYDPNKGDFSWWASKYIGTRVSRSANCHSTIKIPLKKARKLTPFKDSNFPVVIDEKSLPDLLIENEQVKELLSSVINELPEQQKKAILLHYDFVGTGNCSISAISRELKITRPICVKILDEATQALKLKLENLHE